MALIVEDGTIVANANAYADSDFIKEYALARGVTLTDATIETKAIIAMDYIESKRNEFQGIKVSNLQPLQFPRLYLVIDDNQFPANQIPIELKNALSQLVIEQENGINILPTANKAPVKKTTIGPISKEYAVNPGEIFEPIIKSVDILLEPLLKSVSKSGFKLSTLRV
jgi:hypothetical protein